MSAAETHCPWMEVKIKKDQMQISLCSVIKNSKRGATPRLADDCDRKWRSVAQSRKWACLL